MLALYHFGPVANSLTPLLCLIEKGLDFEDRFLNPRHWDHHTPEFRAVNPRGTVPVLIHDDRTITESTAINEYLDDVFPNDMPLRPACAFERAQMRIWTKYVDEYFCPALTILGAQTAQPFASKIDKSVMRERLARMPDPEVRRKWETISTTGYSEERLAEAQTRLSRVIAAMESQLAVSGDWILPSGYSLADIKLYSMTPGVERILPDICKAQARPRVYDWLRRMDARPAVQAMRARDYGDE